MSRRERGAGTVLISAVVAMLVAGTVCMVWAIGWIMGVMRSERVADLAAVAGAQAAMAGRDGCAQAREVARRHRGSVAECTLKGEPPAFVLVVAVEVPLWPQVPVAGLPRVARDSAAAGPRLLHGAPAEGEVSVRGPS